jgi:hypothetical protein
MTRLLWYFLSCMLPATTGGSVRYLINVPVLSHAVTGVLQCITLIQRIHAGYRCNMQ